MLNPVQIGRFLKKRYIKYIEAGIPLPHPKYAEERRALYEEEGSNVVMRSPIIELVKKYQGVRNIYEVCGDPINGIPNGHTIADFLSSGLLKLNNGEYKLYPHQEEAFSSTIKEHRNIVVTTGTGSGKTESFMIPLLTSLALESLTWTATRPKESATRAMILYPLNALAEDQMVRLRKSLDSDAVKTWFAQNVDSGDRITFGRYTGNTPKKKQSPEVETLRREWEEYRNHQDQDPQQKIRFMMTNTDRDSAELYDRETMRVAPPDILITNYNMLNVMLMRDQEADLLKKTRDWLRHDGNVFTLVVDELHSYRGTSGTEVSYIIKVLFDRLGLVRDDGSIISDKIRILASSASIANGDAATSFIQNFFGMNDDFHIIGDNEPVPVSRNDLGDFPNFDIFEHVDFSDTQNLPERINEVLNGTSIDQYVIDNNLGDWLRYALQEDGHTIPKSIEEIARCLGGVSNKTVEILLSLINIAKINGDALLPMRAHYFARNIDSLWICENPNCYTSNDRFYFPGRRFGRMYSTPKSRCSCGSKVYEVAVCRHCGEIYLGGYVTDEKIVNNEKTTTFGQKKVIGSTNSVLSYRLLWVPRPDAIDDDVKNDLKNDIFTNYWNSCAVQRVQLGKGEWKQDPNGMQCFMFSPKSNESPRFPDKCPNCSKQTWVKEGGYNLMPLFRHGTGVSKVNQVFADSLSDILESQEGAGQNKLILFSDSRQDASKLSSGIELDHYRDVLRQAFILAFNGGDLVEPFLRYLDDAGCRPEPGIRAQNIPLYQRIRDFHDNVEDGVLAGDAIEIQKRNLRAEICRSSLDMSAQRFEKIRTSLLDAGIFPFGPSVSKRDIFGDLINWQENKLHDDVDQERVKSYVNSFKVELLKSVIGLRRTSLENIKLGYLHYDGVVGELTSEIVDSIIRYLAENYSIEEKRDFPSGTIGYVNAALASNDNATKLKKNELKRMLAEANIIHSEQDVSLKFDNLQFIPYTEGDPKWICPKCGTHYLQNSSNKCIYCKEDLIEDNSVGTEDQYYVELAKRNRIKRLHCEELTGQTLKSDSLKRQRLFQAICYNGDIKKRDEIDLISATTTMEAGVDIGSLNAVMMGNVPPQRFNYQQRVGRAGRRGTPLSLAVTVAKINSHDQSHYLQPNRMVMGDPAAPYVKKDSEEIVRRILVKECLYMAFKSINNPAIRRELDKRNEDVHGQFGSVFDWENGLCLKNHIENWISSNHTLIEATVRKFTDNVAETTNYITNNLINDINKTLSRSEFIQPNLSERLAAAGLLPMFGFPTQSRNMYVERLKFNRRDQHSFDRPADMALNTFVPGSEITWDKRVYTSIGFVGYDLTQPNSHQYEFIKSTEGLDVRPSMSVWKCSCGYTTVSSFAATMQCPVCGKAMENKANVQAAIPQGYQAGQKFRDFDGAYEWQMRSSTSQIDSPRSIDLHNISDSHLRIGCNQTLEDGVVNTVNSNNGNFFRLTKIAQNIGTYPRGYYSEEWWNKIVNENGDSPAPLALTGERNDFVLFVSKKTGILEVAIDCNNAEICINPIDPNCIESDFKYNLIRGAYLSWGMLLRRSIVNELDIDFNELSVDYYTGKLDNVSNKSTPIVFFTEKLENGAGYASYLADDCSPDTKKRVFVESLTAGGSVYNVLVNPEHMHKCDSSCYDCLRDYFNRNDHELLDWRIGLDMAKIAANEEVPDLRLSYWEDLVPASISSFIAANNNWTQINLQNTYALRQGNECVIILHPLWSKQKARAITDELRSMFQGTDLQVKFVIINQFVDTGLDSTLLEENAIQATLNATPAAIAAIAGNLQTMPAKELTFVGTPDSVSNKSIEDIWQGLLDYSDTLDDVTNATNLRNHQRGSVPDYDDPYIMIDGQQLHCKYLWKDKHVMLFYTYQRNAYDILQREATGWQCFILGAEFNEQDFINAIS